MAPPWTSRPAEPRLSSRRRGPGRRCPSRALLGATDRRSARAVLQPRRLVRASGVSASRPSTAPRAPRAPGYHFTDLSPSGNVVRLNRRLRLHVARHGDRARPEPSAPADPAPRQSLRLITEPSEISEQLSRAASGTLYEDHVGAAAAHHLVLARERETPATSLFRRDRRKNLPLFASLIYVGDPVLFRAGQRLVYRHLLLRHRIPFTLVELRVSGSRPRGPSCSAPRGRRCTVARP